VQAVGKVQASAATAPLEWLIVIETLGAVAKVARRCGAVSEDIQHIQYIQEPLSHAVCS